MRAEVLEDFAVGVRQRRFEIFGERDSIPLARGCAYFSGGASAAGATLASSSWLSTAQRQHGGDLGARLSGGGFGGITVHLVAESEAENYRRRLGTAYETRTGRKPETMICHAADGAQLLG